MEERIDLIRVLDFFQRHKKIIESNIKRDEEELYERERLGRERGIKEPLVIPEGYIDRDKDLREQIKISREQLESCEETINDMRKFISLSFR